MNRTQEIALEAARLENERLCREHPLRQLFWECTLRCNLSCRHCGSDCAKDVAATEMPLGDFLKVLDEIATHSAAVRLSAAASSGDW